MITSLADTGNERSSGMKQQIPSKLVNRQIARDDADAAISLR
jgi:hypothetical protein